MEFGIFCAAPVGPKPWDESEPRRLRDRGGNAAVLHLSFMNQYYGGIFSSKGYKEFADLSAKPYGDAERCAEIVGRYQAAGFDHYFALVQYGTLTHGESMASLRTFAEKVMPRFA